MAKLQAYQVAAAALLAGFPPGEVPKAVAVARGESSFNTTSSNSCCSGLWQIHRTAHADKIAAAGGASKLTDPVTNARLALQIWKAAGGWCTTGRVGQCNPWQAYGMNNAGMSWQAKLAEGAKAYAEVQRRQSGGETLAAMAGGSGIQDADFPTPPNPLEGVLDAARAIAGFAQGLVDFGNKLGRWVSDPGNWIRVAQVIGGGALVLVGLRITFNSQINTIAREAVGWIGPKGKAAKIATKAKGIGT